MHFEKLTFYLMIIFGFIITMENGGLESSTSHLRNKNDDIKL